jgi:hypothetical protein
MPIRFDPPDLFDRWKTALTCFSSKELCSDSWPDVTDDAWDPKDWNSEDDDDFVVSENTNFDVYPRETDGDPYECSLGAVIEWSAELRHAKIVDRNAYVSPIRMLFHVAPVDGIAARFAEADAPLAGEHLFEQQLDISGRALCLAMTFGLTPFALLIDNVDADYCPSVYRTDAFVEVRWDGNPPELEDVREIVDAYLFTVCRSGFDYKVSRFRELIDDWEPEDWEMFTFSTVMNSSPGELRDCSIERATTAKDKLIEQLRAIRLRPLILGAGMGDVYALFHRAAGEHLDDEYRALCYVKIVEYVSMTVIKQKAHGEIRRRLADERTLVPDAGYIEDLIQLVNAQREFRKDAEALRLTVLVVADPIVLSLKAPAFLPALRKCAQDAADKDRERALDELAAAMTATRNQIAHSKANYSLTGKECPPGQLAEFVGLLRLLGMQAIYWFGNIPDRMRVVR